MTTDPDANNATYAGRTAWARNLAAPVRDFLGTETGGASVLLAGDARSRSLWANSPWSHSYESLWTHDTCRCRLGSSGISIDLRHWVNEGLMTLFFLVVGLEAKRELDLGELRERQRLAIPVLAALGGMAVPVAIYLAFNAGGPGAHGWGAAMSTDTAFALGALALLTPRAATRLRVFLLTLAVVDDLCALLVIATVVHRRTSRVPALAIAVGAVRACCWRCATRRQWRAAACRSCVGVGAVGRDVRVGHRPGDLGPRGRASRRAPTRPRARTSSARPR